MRGNVWETRGARWDVIYSCCMCSCGGGDVRRQSNDMPQDCHDMLISVVVRATCIDQRLVEALFVTDGCPAPSQPTMPANMHGQTQPRPTVRFSRLSRPFFRTDARGTSAVDCREPTSQEIAAGCKIAESGNDRACLHVQAPRHDRETGTSRFRDCRAAASHEIAVSSTRRWARRGVLVVYYCTHAARCGIAYRIFALCSFSIVPHGPPHAGNSLPPAPPTKCKADGHQRKESNDITRTRDESQKASLGRKTVARCCRHPPSPVPLCVVSIVFRHHDRRTPLRTAAVS